MMTWGDLLYAYKNTGKLLKMWMKCGMALLLATLLLFSLSSSCVAVFAAESAPVSEAIAATVDSQAETASNLPEEPVASVAAEADSSKEVNSSAETVSETYSARFFLAGEELTEYFQEGIKSGSSIANIPSISEVPESEAGKEFYGWSLRNASEPTEYTCEELATATFSADVAFDAVFYPQTSLFALFSVMERDADGYYLIKTPADLISIKDDMSASYRLANDIDFSGYRYNAKDSTDAKGYQPPGSSIKPFTGILDGNNKTIFNLRSSGTGTYVGLFAFTKMATIKNLTMDFGNNEFKGTYEVGAIVGRAKEGTVVDNVHIKNASFTVTAGGYAGGLAGYADESTFSNCSVTNVRTTTSGNYSAGFIGALKDTTVDNCQGSGITADGHSYIAGAFGVIHGQPRVSNISITDVTVNSRGSYAGGFIGAPYEGSVAGVEMENCSVTNVTVTSGVSYAGGFAGVAYNKSALVNCNVTNANVSGCNYVGGFAGVIYDSASATNCRVINAASIAPVTASSNFVGGFAGAIYNQAVITNCLSNAAVKAEGKYAGGFVGDVYDCAVVTRAVALGNVNAESYVGGFAGKISGFAKVDTTCAYGNVTQAARPAVLGNVGGFAGDMSCSSTVTDVYSRGNVQATGENCGGFVGDTDCGISITNAYSSGSVSSSGTTTAQKNSTAAFIGECSTKNLTNTYYDNQTAGGLQAIGKINKAINQPVGKNTAWMKKQITFVGFNFNKSTGGVWHIDEDETYPYFEIDYGNPGRVTVKPAAMNYGKRALSSLPEVYYLGTPANLWQATVRDTRNPANPSAAFKPWQVSLQITKPLTSTSGDVLENVVYWKGAGGTNVCLDTPGSFQSVVVQKGATTWQEYSTVQWNGSNGVLLEIPTGAAFAEKYNGEVTWTIADAP